MKKRQVLPSIFQRSPPLPILFLVLAVALSLGGCAARDNWEGLGDGLSDADRLFQEGESRPPTAATLYAMARIVKGQGKESVYRFILERIINEYPHFVPAYCDLAELSARQSRFDAAIETLSAGLRVSPDDPVLINDIGICWLLKKNYERSLAYSTQAAALGPGDVSYRANMAVALGMLGRYEECLSLYKQVVPEWDAHYNLAVLCEARKDVGRAAEEYRKARELSPQKSADSRHGTGETPPLALARVTCLTTRAIPSMAF